MKNKKVNELEINKLATEINKKLLHEVIDKIFKIKNKRGR